MPLPIVTICGAFSFGRGMKEIGTYSFTGYDWTGTGQGGCPLLGEIICRAATPPTLEESYGSGPFGGSYEIVAGSKAETRVIHLPESDDPSLSTGRRLCEFGLGAADHGSL